LFPKRRPVCLPSQPPEQAGGQEEPERLHAGLMVCHEAQLSVAYCTIMAFMFAQHVGPVSVGRNMNRTGRAHCCSTGSARGSVGACSEREERGWWVRAAVSPAKRWRVKCEPMWFVHHAAVQPCPAHEQGSQPR